MRQAWLRELACSRSAELADLFNEAVSDLDVEVLNLKGPEIGLVLAPGRVSATGDPFGLGEVTVTRCIVEVKGLRGVGYVRGRDPLHARRVAVIDALLQGPGADSIRRNVIEPLAVKRQHRERLRSNEVDASRVEFFTLVRGD